jgi:hypothetical protein
VKAPPVLLTILVAACGGAPGESSVDAQGLGAADGGTVLDPARFDRRCATVADCVAVVAGQLCPEARGPGQPAAGCFCPNAAISRDAEDGFQAAESAIVARACPGLVRVNVCACVATHLACTQGACALEVP